MDTRSRCNDIDLRKILLSGSQDQRLQVQLAQFQGVHVGTDDAELFSLLDTHLSVHSSLDFLNRSLDIFRQVRGHIKGLVVLQQSGGNSGSRFAKDIRKHIVQFDIGNCQAVLGAVLLPGSEIGQLPMVAHQIPELADIRWWDKTAGHQIVLEDVGDPFGVFLVGFLSPNCLDVLGVGQNNGAGGFQNVVNGYPILPGGFHAHILAVVLCQPSSTSAQIIGERREPFALISCNPLPIC